MVSGHSIAESSLLGRNPISARARAGVATATGHVLMYKDISFWQVGPAPAMLSTGSDAVGGLAAASAHKHHSSQLEQRQHGLRRPELKAKHPESEGPLPSNP